MSKAERTRAHIVENAAAVFNQRGYAGASMADLMAATGLKKGGLYNHFRSKDELALAAFDYAIEQMQQRFRGAIAHRRHATDRLIAMLRVYEHMLDQPPIAGGCPILNTAVDSDDTHPALQAKAQAAMDGWRRLIIRIVNKGIARGELSANIHADTVATVLISTIEGSVMMSKLYNDTTYIQQALNHLKDYIQTQLAVPS
ncbi:MAG: TetR/AcrR family transcriptional regulator [Cyanobacteria bacterium J06632_22]